MDFDNIALTTAGFGLYCLALILKSTSLRHLRFARIVDLNGHVYLGKGRRAQVEFVSANPTGPLHVGQLKRDLIPHYKSEVELELMRSIKNALDPRGLMNPGKVI